MTTANWDSLSLSLSHVTTVTVTRTDRNIISIIYTTSGLNQAQASTRIRIVTLSSYKSLFIFH